jgi:hypothetical protein
MVFFFDIDTAIPLRMITKEFILNTLNVHFQIDIMGKRYILEKILVKSNHSS